MIQSSFSSCFLCVSFFFFTACTVQDEGQFLPDTAHNFKISVSTQCKQVERPEEPLVHRIVLNSSVVHDFVAKGKPGSSSLAAGVERDNNGRLAGVRISSLTQASALARIGLKNNDLVTAVGKNKLKAVEDLWSVFDDLDSKGHATLTIERNGMPHKILIDCSVSANAES